MATVTLVPLGTYPAQSRTFTAALPGGTTGVQFQIHAAVQAPFDYSVDFSVSKDGGTTWTWVCGASAIARATDTTCVVDTHGCDHLKADVVLNTAITASMTAVTTP